MDIKLWTRPDEVEASRARPAAQHQRPALGGPPRRRDARRALRQGRDRRLGHRDAGRGRAGRRRRRHRLRHGARSRPTSRAAICPTTCERLRSDIEAAIPVGLRTPTTRRAAPELASGRALWDEFASADARGAGAAQAGRAASSARSAAATTSSRSASTRTSGVWLMLHSGSRNIGKELAELHIAMAQEARPQPRPARPRPRGVPRRHAGDGRLPARSLLGAGVRALEPRGHARTCRAASLRQHFPAASTFDERDLLPPQLRRRGGPLRRGGAGDAQGRDPRRPGRARHHPRLDGHALVHRARPRQPGVVRVRVARRRPPDEPRRGEAALHGRRTWPRRPRASSAARTPA